MSLRLVSSPIRRGLYGQVQVPGDKSISHRAAMLASFAHGRSTIRGWLQATDTKATLQACEQLGAGVQWCAEADDPVLLIDGCGGSFKTPEQVLDLGNSGTGVRLLLGLLAGQDCQVGLSGDASLCQRPMGRIIRPLLQMGARFADERARPIAAEQSALLPLRSLGPAGGGLQGIEYHMPMASAQVQAAVLLAGLQAAGDTRVIQPGVCRDHSERMLQHFGADIQRLDAATLVIRRSDLQATDVTVPADISSASFLLAAATLQPGSAVQLAGIGVNPTRDGILRVLAEMGAAVTQGEPSTAAEPVANLRARAAGLHGVDVPEQWVPNCIDEFPLIMALAALADGTTRIRGAAELRVKESDRLAVMSTALQQLGVPLREYDDGVDVTGLCTTGSELQGGRVDAHGDHRIAMSLAVLGMRAAAPILIDNAEQIATSYPQFVAHMNQLGADLQWQ